jgi:hypothetical protein
VAAEYYRIWFRDITLRLNSLLDENSYNRSRSPARSTAA